MRHYFAAIRFRAAIIFIIYFILIFAITLSFITFADISLLLMPLMII
jgi:hypothetical protein